MLKLSAFKRLILISLVLLIEQSDLLFAQNKLTGESLAIIGKWVSRNKEFGDVILELRKDGSGYTSFNSSKSVYIFKYHLIGDSLIKLSSAKGPPDIHCIKLKDSKKLSLRPYPFKKYRESIALIDTDYQRQ